MGGCTVDSCVAPNKDALPLLHEPHSPMGGGRRGQITASPAEGVDDKDDRCDGSASLKLLYLTGVVELFVLGIN